MVREINDEDVAVFGWVIPRPTGRWHQAIVVTARHVWVTPELTFKDNEKLEAAATAGLFGFHDFVRGAGWVKRPPRCDISAVRRVDWNAITGWMQLSCADDSVIGAMIPNRESGGALQPLLKKAIGVRVPEFAEQL